METAQSVLSGARLALKNQKGLAQKCLRAAWLTAPGTRLLDGANAPHLRRSSAVIVFLRLIVFER